MALTTEARNRLVVGMAHPGVGKEVADAIDATAPLTANNTFSGSTTFSGTVTHTANTSFKRFDGKQSTSHIAGDYALSGGFGSTASIAVATGSNDTRGQFTVTSAGTGQGANPTITLTFKDGTWTTAPFAQVCRNGGSQRTVIVDVTTTATTMVVTFLGTPVAAETYIISFSVEG